MIVASALTQRGAKAAIAALAAGAADYVPKPQGSAGGAAHLVIAQRGDRLGGNVDFGVGYTGGTSLTGLDTSLWTRLALSGDWRPHTRFGLGGELWFQASPLSSATFVQASPGEALLRASASLTDQLWVSLAGGTAITPGVGAAVGRAGL